MARKIPFDDPDVLNYTRIGYVAVQVIVLGVYYYISMAVRRTEPSYSFHPCLLADQIQE